MLILADEHIPNSVVQFLKDREHDVMRTRHVLGSSTRDEIIAAYGDPLGAVVLTKDGDFQKLKKKHLNLGLIHLKCRDTELLDRLRLFIEIIELEYQNARSIEGGQFWITVNNAMVIIHR